MKLETGVARGYWHELDRWESSPATGEVSEEQLVEMAIVGLTNISRKEDMADIGYGEWLPEVFLERETLEKMESRVFLDCSSSAENARRWRICFWEMEGGDAVVVSIDQEEGNPWYYRFNGYFLPQDSGKYTFPYVL